MSGAGITQVTGGGEISLPYADVLALAGCVEASGDRALHAAGRAGVVAASPHLAVSAPYSPATAAAAEAALVTLGASLTAWSGAALFDAQGVRRAARLLADADDVARLGLRNLECTLAVADTREAVAPRVRPTDLRVPSSSTAPADLPALIEHVSEVNDLSDGAHPENKGTIEVQTITAADGSRRHIVYLPGLDDMDPVSVDGDVRDMAAVVALEAGVPTAYGAGVVRALHDAGVAQGEDVLLVGHSQGGMQAAALAVQGTPYHVTHVVTAGSPVVPGHLPHGVHVLSLEHQGDPVPLADGGSVDHSPQHVTATFDSGMDLIPFANHHLAHYVGGAHAAEQSTDPVVQQAVAGLDPFLAHPGDQVRSTVFQVTRGDDVPLSPALGAEAAVGPVGTLLGQLP